MEFEINGVDFRPRKHKSVWNGGEFEIVMVNDWKNKGKSKGNGGWSWEHNNGEFEEPSSS